MGHYIGKFAHDGEEKEIESQGFLVQGNNDKLVLRDNFYFARGIVQKVNPSEWLVCSWSLGLLLP